MYFLFLTIKMRRTSMKCFVDTVTRKITTRVHVSNENAKTPTRSRTDLEIILVGVSSVTTERG